MSPEGTSAVRRRMPQDARRAQLLDVCERLFVEHGYAAVSMEDIARAADVTRPVVYNHFQTKEGAYLACVRRAREAYDAGMLVGIEADMPPRQQLEVGAEQFFSLLEQDRGRWFLLFGGTAVLPETYWGELGEIRLGTIRAIAELLKQSAPIDMAPDRIEAWAHAVSGVGERLGHWWLAEPRLTKAELVDHYTDILWSGLRSYVE